MSGSRQPRLLVLANGAALPGVIDAEVVSNNHYAADRFRVSVAINADTVGTTALVGLPEILLVERI
jgi:hypothetical protein